MTPIPIRETTFLIEETVAACEVRKEAAKGDE